MQKWLYTNLQKWTPFSALLVVAGVGMMFVIIWDVVNNLPIQPFIIGILSLLLGSSGAATLFSHGVNVANGVAKDTAVAVVKQTAAITANTQATQDKIQAINANTHATQNEIAAINVNTQATQENTQATSAKG